MRFKVWIKEHFTSRVQNPTICEKLMKIFLRVGEPCLKFVEIETKHKENYLMKSYCDLLSCLMKELPSNANDTLVQRTLIFAMMLTFGSLL